MKTFINFHTFSLVRFLLCFLFKILVFCISKKIELRFVHVFNLVYVVGNIVK